MKGFGKTPQGPEKIGTSADDSPQVGGLAGAVSGLYAGPDALSFHTYCHTTTFQYKILGISTLVYEQPHWTQD